MTTAALYRRHLAVLDGILADALERAGRQGLKLSGVLFHAGRAAYYHRDDQEIAFRATPHFLRYAPLNGPEHCLLARPGRTPRLVRVAPRDYWYETVKPEPSYWQQDVELAEVAAFSDVLKVTGPLADTAYVGNSKEAAGELGIPGALVEPEVLIAALDWARARKTDHEIALMEVAAERAAEGHRVARKAFESGASERQIHWAFVEASGMLEKELPFEAIVAYDEKTATLHYQNKRSNIPTRKQVFMLDAGASCDGYASDVTRTWVKSGVHPVFEALLRGLDAAQRDLVGMVTAGRPFLELHVEAHRRTARLLAETNIVKTSADECFRRGITRTFLPHGLGHHLGVQVHDVGGRLAGPDGGVTPPPPDYPALRNTRTLEPGHVVTIEPGIYFIPMLLDQLRADPAGQSVDWALVEQLIPHGGMRIEDDVLCTDGAPRDLTRRLIQGPRGV